MNLAGDPALLPRPSARVKRVAELLDMDESQVRRAVDAGEMEAHGHGKRGLRIYLDSVADYQNRRNRAPTRPIATQQQAKPPRPTQASQAAHNAALANLRADGFV
jgi:hypothetical protein